MTEPQDTTPANALLTLIVTLLAPMFLTVCGGDIALAQAAALETVNDYRAQNHAGLIAVALIVAYGLAALSSREREVAVRVASGSTNRQVAAALFLSEKTIGSHLARIYGKLGVHSRAALATIVARDGDPSDPVGHV